MSAEITGSIRQTAAGVPTPARLRLVKLVRISKDRDNQSSIANQHYDLDEWARYHDADIVQEYVEVARSGWKDIPRPYLDDALAMVRAGLADGIMVWKVSRFSRKGALEIFRMLDYCRTGSGFLIATHDAIDTRGMEMADIIKLTVIAENAKRESDDKSAFGKAWHRGRLRGKDGVPLPPVGRRPYGYDRKSSNVLTPNAKEARVVRAMVDDFLSGARTVRAIARDLNANHPREDAWTHRGVSYILKSPTIAGGRVIAGAFVAGDWDAIISVEQWEACKAKLADPSRRSAHTNKPQWLLTGIATCGREDCDGSIRAKHHAGTGVYRYTCKRCEQSIPVAVADEVVTATTLDYLAGDAWRELRASGRASVPGNVDFLTARLDHARGRWLAGKISDAEWDTTHDEITATIERIQSAPVLELPDVDNLAEAWNDASDPLSLEGRRQVIRAAFQSIRILPHGKNMAGAMRVEVI